MRTAVFFSALALGLGALVGALPGSDVRPASADVIHVVQRGQALELIAQKYHVTIRAICHANGLALGAPLTPGQSLVIPGVDPREMRGETVGISPSKLVEGRASEPRPDPKHRVDKDVIDAMRLDEEFHIRLNDGHGRIPASALREFEQLMRQGDNTHTPDPRLLEMIGVVANHFAGRTLEVVSGFRAYKPTQYTPHSRHNQGKALDFRVRGVSNEELRDFCRTLHNTGCGYYPNSTFVHLDVRDASATWVDLARPGEPPRYLRADGTAPPETTADEGTTDVTSDSH
jgi:uncharacterized protein YcbK (DUF882 family)